MAGDEADRRGARVTRGPAGGERRAGLRAAGTAAARIAAPIVARHGGGTLARLKSAWTAVAGADLARLAWPEALARDGALKLRVEPAFALELQHRAPQLIEQINLFFGRAAVARLVLRQARMPGGAPPAPQPAPPLAAAERRDLDAKLAEISDPELRAALSGLGRLVLSAPRRGR